MNPAMSTAAITSLSPNENEPPVRVYTYPNTYGPANPAMLPTELMSPTAVAASAWLNISVGIAQNVDR
jgi:hypothetical protein